MMTPNGMKTAGSTHKSKAAPPKVPHCDTNNSSRKEREMRSKSLPREMRALARRLPIITVSVNGQPRPFVSSWALHRVLSVYEAVDPWIARWADEWDSLVAQCRVENIRGDCVQRREDGSQIILAGLACCMAWSGPPQTRDTAGNYLRVAELRWRILRGLPLLASEVASEFGLEIGSNVSKRISDSITEFAARTDGVPRVSSYGCHHWTSRSFPVALVKAWHKRGGGAAMIEREHVRERPPKAPKVRPLPDLADYDFGEDARPF